MDLDKLRRSKNKSIIDVKCEKNSLPIAILFGKLDLDSITPPKLRHTLIRNLKRCPNKLNKEAENFARDVMGTDFRTDGKYGIQFIRNFLLKNESSYRITLYQSNHKYIPIKSKKTQYNKHKNINIFYSKENQHYFYIKNVKGFFGFKSQCSHCEELYHVAHDCSIEL